MNGNYYRSSPKFPYPEGPTVALFIDQFKTWIFKTLFMTLMLLQPVEFMDEPCSTLFPYLNS